MIISFSFRKELLYRVLFVLYGVAMKKITKEMIKIYKPLGTDWLNYKVTQSNQLTFHHILKKVDGGKEELTNGALLTEIAHQYLHIIEYRDIDTYRLLNKMLKMINKQMTAPTPGQREVIEYLLREFESAHKEDKNSKGKLLIQYKYLDR